MFENELSEKLKKIFDVKKVSFDAPGEAMEQETLFIEVSNVRSFIKDQRVVGKADAKAYYFATNQKLPFGYWAKKIALADINDSESFFFYDLEQNSQIFRDKIQRSFSFVYFFNRQFDPEKGTISSIIISEGMT